MFEVRTNIFGHDDELTMMMMKRVAAETSTATSRVKRMLNPVDVE
jgi:hypothetical protein